MENELGTDKTPEVCKMIGTGVNHVLCMTVYMVTGALEIQIFGFKKWSDILLIHG